MLTVGVESFVLWFQAGCIACGRHQMGASTSIASAFLVGSCDAFRMWETKPSFHLSVTMKPILRFRLHNNNKTHKFVVGWPQICAKKVRFSAETTLTEESFRFFTA